MIFNKGGIAFPDYQKTEKAIFKQSLKHNEEQWNYIKTVLTKTRTCLDFGAHVGTSAIRYSGHFDLVVSFEPIPDLFECLEKNTENLSNVEIHNNAIGDENKEIEILLNTDNSGSSIIPSEATEKIIKSRWGNEKRQEFQEMPSLKVESRTIDSYGFNEVDFIKIDTEGYNIQPLRGMKETLIRCLPAIQLERSNDESYLEETHNFLKDLGYTLVKTMGSPKDDIFVSK